MLKEWWKASTSDTEDKLLSKKKKEEEIIPQILSIGIHKEHIKPQEKNLTLNCYRNFQVKKPLNHLLGVPLK